MSTPDFARVLDHVADRFIEDAAPELMKLALDRLDGDDPDPVGRVVDVVVERLREELSQAVRIGIGGA